VGIGPDFTIFTATFDALIGILVKIGKVFPELFVSGMDDIAVLDGSEFSRQSPDGGGVEFILMRLAPQLV
jgi:hypothetical protein